MSLLLSPSRRELALPLITKLQLTSTPTQGTGDPAAFCFQLQHPYMLVGYCAVSHQCRWDLSRQLASPFLTTHPSLQLLSPSSSYTAQSSHPLGILSSYTCRNESQSLSKQLLRGWRLQVQYLMFTSGSQTTDFQKTPFTHFHVCIYKHTNL